MTGPCLSSVSRNVFKLFCSKAGWKSRKLKQSFHTRAFRLSLLNLSHALFPSNRNLATQKKMLNKYFHCRTSTCSNWFVCFSCIRNRVILIVRLKQAMKRCRSCALNPRSFRNKGTILIYKPAEVPSISNGLLRIKRATWRESLLQRVICLYPRVRHCILVRWNCIHW